MKITGYWVSLTGTQWWWGRQGRLLWGRDISIEKDAQKLVRHVSAQLFKIFLETVLFFPAFVWMTLNLLTAWASLAEVMAEPTHGFCSIWELSGPTELHGPSSSPSEVMALLLRGLTIHPGAWWEASLVARTRSTSCLFLISSSLHGVSWGL